MSSHVCRENMVVAVTIKAGRGGGGGGRGEDKKGFWML